MYNSHVIPNTPTIAGKKESPQKYCHHDKLAWPSSAYCRRNTWRWWANTLFMALFVKSIQIVCSASTRLVLHIRSIVVDFGMSQDNEKFSKADMKGNALLLQSNAFHFRRHPIIISFFYNWLGNNHLRAFQTWHVFWTGEQRSLTMNFWFLKRKPF